MRKIPLTRGKFALVDDADYEWLSQWKWHALKSVRKGETKFYACRHGGYGRNSGVYIYMHRLIMDAPPERSIDHADTDTLNNQRENLRFATHFENMANKKKQTVKNGLPVTSRYKGVNLDKRRGRWNAEIRKGNKKTWLGSFLSEVDAAKAYDAAAVRLHGEFCSINFKD